MEIMMQLLIVLLFAVIIVAIVIATNAMKKAQEQLQKYRDIQIGMPEKVMLDIMGEGYNRSLLKNNRIKYEWRINARSYGSSYSGMRFTSYSGVKKVSIYVKNGVVEEVKPYNV